MDAERSPRLRAGRALGRAGGAIAGLPFALVLLGGAAVRLAAARDGLWLDEIWSLVFARGAPSAWDLLVLLHHDNNHVLESWLLRAMDGVTSPLVIRLPSIAAGVAAIVAAGLIARPRGRADALVAMILVAGSFPLVQYSSEARGYSLAVLFALAAWLALRSFIESSRFPAAATFWICCVLGVLAHMTFVTALVGFGAFSIGTWLRRGGMRLAGRETLRCHAVPIAATIAVVAMTLPDMVVGSGPARSGWSVVAAALSLVAGGPRGGMLAIAAAVVVVSVLAASLVRLRRERDPEWLLYLGAIGIGPALLVAVARQDFWAERYFLLPTTFAILLLGRLIGAATHGMRAGRVAAAFALVIVLAGNARHVAGLVVLGRGDPLAALDFVAGRGRSVQTLMSSNDFRTELLLRWRGQADPQAPAVEYFDMLRARDGDAGWWLVESFDESAPAPPMRRRAGGTRYRLVRTFPHSGLSGWTYFAYRRVDDRTPR